MEILVITILAILVLAGPVVGSFFAAWVMRQTNISKAEGKHSQCDHTGKKLQWFELIPIVSFLWLRGKSRYSDKKLDMRMWYAEVLGLLTYTLLAYGLWQIFTNLGLADFALGLIFFLPVTTTLFYLSVYDLFTFTVPTIIVQYLLGYSLLFNIVFAVGRIVAEATRTTFFSELTIGTVMNVGAAIAGALLIYVLIKLTKGQGMGWGDLYIVAVVGLALGWIQSVAAFYITIFSATIFGTGLAVYLKKFKGLPVPLIPFVLLGFAGALALGEQIYYLLFPVWF